MNSQALRILVIGVLVFQSLFTLPACQPTTSHSQSPHTENTPVREESGLSTSPQDSPDPSYWTPERMKKAKPMPIPAVPDPTIRGELPMENRPPASEHQKRGGGGGGGDGSQGKNPPVRENSDPSTDPSYWTPERMRKAKPMPTPAIPDPSIQGESPGGTTPPEALPREGGGVDGSPGGEEAQPQYSR